MLVGRLTHVRCCCEHCAAEPDKLGAPPFHVPRYHIRLLQAGSHECCDSFELRPYEHALCMQEVGLKERYNAPREPMLAVGTGFVHPRGEFGDSRGAVRAVGCAADREAYRVAHRTLCVRVQVYLFSVRHVNVEGAGGEMTTQPRLKKVHVVPQIRAPVSAMSMLRDYIIIGAGPKVRWRSSAALRSPAALSPRLYAVRNQ